MPGYTQKELEALRDFYRDSLLDDTLKFWLPGAIDTEYGGYLHRDGRISTGMKGNLFKGPFHLPRMQTYCWQLLAGS